MLRSSAATGRLLSGCTLGCPRMYRAIRPVRHEDHLSLVDHLDELRTRLIICLVALGVAFGLCFWQNHALLHLIGNPYSKETRGQVVKCKGELGPVWCAD